MNWVFFYFLKFRYPLENMKITNIYSKRENESSISSKPYNIPVIIENVCWKSSVVKIFKPGNPWGLKICHLQAEQKQNMLLQHNIEWTPDNFSHKHEMERTVLIKFTIHISNRNVLGYAENRSSGIRHYWATMLSGILKYDWPKFLNIIFVFVRGFAH